jgi:hypothetical protein
MPTVAPKVNIGQCCFGSLLERYSVVGLAMQPTAKADKPHINAPMANIGRKRGLFPTRSFRQKQHQPFPRWQRRLVCVQALGHAMVDCSTREVATSSSSKNERARKNQLWPTKSKVQTDEPALRTGVLHRECPSVL